MLLFIAGMLFVVSTFLVLTPQYDDGIVGKILLSMLAVSSYCVLFTNGHPLQITVAVMLASLGGALIRDFVVFKFRALKVKK